MNNSQNICHFVDVPRYVSFQFAANEWFANSVLSKSFELNIVRDKEDPFRHENAALYKSVGTKIDWLEGKDLTAPAKPKAAKVAKDDAPAGGVEHEEEEDEEDDDDDDEESFFTFFNTHTSDGVRPIFKRSGGDCCGDERSEEESKNDYDIECRFEADLELGQLLRESIVPKALLFYTGDFSDAPAMNGEYEDESDEEEDDDDEEGEGEDEEEEKEEKEMPPKKRSKIKPEQKWSWSSN